MITKKSYHHVVSVTLAILFSGIGTTGFTAPSESSKTAASVTPPPAAVDWFDHTVTPVLDPIYLEDAIVRSEIRPIYGYQRIGSDSFFPGGHYSVYGVQIRYAATENLGFMLTKGGYNDVHLGNGANLTGWGDISVGAKYSVVNDKANQFILTPGFTFEIPTGGKEVFQGRGSGIWNVFLAAEKGWGDFHLLANAGFIIPNSTSANSTQLHYHLQADYFVCRWFKPYAALNGYTVLSPGKNLPLNAEGGDLVNFGSSLADGYNQLTLGGGFRSEIAKGIEFGFGYEKAVCKPHGLLDDRFTFDFVIHF